MNSQRSSGLLKQASQSATSEARTPGKSQGSNSSPLYATKGVGGTSVNFPGFVSSPVLSIPKGNGVALTATTNGDFNNDGKMDVATVEVWGLLHVVLNPGSMSNLNTATPVTNTSYQGYAAMTWLTTADLNGDGNLDLIAQDEANSRIVVWLGNGDGTFNNAQTYTVAPNSGAAWWDGGSLIVGDFNGDGAPDIATITLGPQYANGQYSTVVTEQTFLNAADGSGTLLPPTSESDVTYNDFYTSGFGQAALITTDGSKTSGIAFLIGDEGQNNPAGEGIDILTLSINGDGSFTVPSEPTGNALVADRNLAVNGSLYATDLRTKATTAAASKGRGGRSALAEQGTPGSGIATADIVFMTGDGAIYDAPYTAGSPITTVKILAGANSWLPNNSAIAIPNQEYLDVADIDGDGYPDLLVRAIGNAIIFPNGGDAGFTGDPIQLIGGVATNPDGNPCGEQAAPADFDGSGHNSFISTDAELGQLGFYLNLGPSSTSPMGQIYAAPAVAGSTNNGGTSYTAFGNNISVQATADINSDGMQDVIAYDYTNSAANGGFPDLVLGINNGTGNTNAFTFTPGLSAATLSTLGGGLAFIEPLTIPNSAGNTILIVTANGLYTSTINSTGSFSDPQGIGIGPQGACPLSYADAGDMNGDGLIDVVIAYSGDAECGSTGSIPSGYYTMLGSGGDSFRPLGFTPFGRALYQPRLINFHNSANTPDLVLNDMDDIDRQYGLYTLPGNGDGTFNTSNWYEPVTDYIIMDIIPGDYNSDGYQDLTLATQGQYIQSLYGVAPNTEGVLMLPGNGKGQFGTPQTINPVLYAFAVWGSYADFNNDGAPDLVLSEFSPGYTPLVKVLPNLGGGNFGPSLDEFDGFSLSGSSYTFPGTFSRSGGTDLLVSGDYNSALFINQGTTTLRVAVSSSSPDQGTPVTFTVNVGSQIGNPVPASGTITFTNSQTGVQLATAPVVNGVATFTTSDLAVGLNIIVTVYSGDANHLGAGTASFLQVNPVTPGFTLSGSSTMSLVQGATGVATFNLASNSTFSGTVNFTCSGVPTAASCTVNPGSLTLGASQTGTVSVVIATTPKNNQYQASNHWMMALTNVSLAGVVFFLVPRRRRLRGMLMVIAVGLLSLGSLAMLSGCGGSDGAKYPGTPIGTTNVTITATSGSVTQSQTMALTITAN